MGEENMIHQMWQTIPIWQYVMIGIIGYIISLITLALING